MSRSRLDQEAKKQNVRERRHSGRRFHFHPFHVYKEPILNGAKAKAPTLLEITTGRRVLVIGGQGERPEHRKALMESFALSELDWLVGERSETAIYQRIRPRIKPGRYDFVLLLTRFISHASEGLVRLIKDNGIPVIYIRGGYGVMMVGDAIMEQCPPLPPLIEKPKAEEAQQAELLPFKPAPLHNSAIVEGFKVIQKAGTVTQEVRKRAISWIAEHDEAGFAPFEREFPYKELDHAFWSSIIRTLQHEKDSIKAQEATPNREIPMVTATKKQSTRSFNPDSDMGKMKAYFANMTDNELRAARFDAYVEATGHKVVKSAFSSAKYITEKLRREGSLKPTRTTTNSKVIPAMTSKTSYQVAAEIDLSQFSGVPYEALKKFADLLVGSILETEVRIVRLASPDAMEIRVAV